MTTDYVSGLMTERETLASAIEGFATRAAERGSDLTDVETTEIASLQTRCAAIDDRIGTFADAQDSNRRYAELMNRVNAGQTSRVAAEIRESAVSSGRAFIDSPAFGEYRGHGVGPVCDLELFGEYRAAGPTLLADLPALPRSQFAQPTGTDRLPLLGIVNVEVISTNGFDYVVDTLTDGTAVVAEGVAKPESDFVQSLVPGTLDMVASWVQLSRQAMEDGPRIAGIIDGKLTSAILKKQNTSVVAALAAATLPSNTFVGAAGSSAGANLLASIRQGIGIVQAAGFDPDAVLMNPADYAALDIDVMLNTLGGPSNQANFWGVIPVASAAQAAGTATVGEYRVGATLFRRSNVQTFITDSHASTFTSNVLTLLAEARSKAVVTNVSCFVDCLGPAVP